MKYNFIKVFSEKDKDRLISSGYKLMKSDDNKHVYVFINDESLSRDFTIDKELEFVMTNTLTF